MERAASEALSTEHLDEMAPNEARAAVIRLPLRHRELQRPQRRHQRVGEPRYHVIRIEDGHGATGREQAVGLAQQGGRIGQVLTEEASGDEVERGVREGCRRRRAMDDLWARRDSRERESLEMGGGGEATWAVRSAGCALRMKLPKMSVWRRARFDSQGIKAHRDARSEPWRCKVLERALDKLGIELNARDVRRGERGDEAKG